MISTTIYYLQGGSTNLAPLFKCQYHQQYSLKPQQAWCQIKALVLYFPGMSLDTSFCVLTKKSWMEKSMGNLLMAISNSSLCSGKELSDR